MHPVITKSFLNFKPSKYLLSELQPIELFLILLPPCNIAYCGKLNSQVSREDLRPTPLGVRWSLKTHTPVLPTAWGVPFPEWANLGAPAVHRVLCTKARHQVDGYCTAQCSDKGTHTTRDSVYTLYRKPGNVHTPERTGYYAHSMTLDPACKHTVYTLHMTPGTTAHISHDTGERVHNTQGTAQGEE